MNGLHFQFNSIFGKSLFKVSEFRFGDEQYIKGHDKAPPEGKVFVLKCRCGSNEWTDNGRTINEYECDGCGQFVTVLERKE
ncbi:MAG: hypothetical protein CME43_01855 [Haliea sp.]|nr:hypothetical protein [Haliea sp.]|tara:strand:- start:1110 stop:1352 length:243 start_codon:yes stop_codon:yes gene_type:complete